MSRKKWIALWSALAACVMYAGLTGGLAVSKVDDFGGQRDIVLAAGLQSDVWLAPRSRTWWVPLVFHYYGAGRPFDLRLQIWETSGQYVAIEITEILVEYNDADVVREFNVWSKRFAPYTHSTSHSGGVTRDEMFMVSDYFPSLVLRHADNKITLKGQLVTANGEKVAFEASETFKAESRSDVTTFWKVLSAV